MNRLAAVFVLVSLILGYLMGYLSGGAKPTATGDRTIQKDASNSGEPLFYRNPMNPAVTSPVPARDHMGMDYIPVFASDQQGPAGTVTVDHATVQSMGVRTSMAVHRTIAREINTVGRVSYDETRIVRLHPKTEGWIDELFVQTTGQTIANDDILLNLYSPQLVASQQEYLLALGNLDRVNSAGDAGSTSRDMVRTSLERLQFLDVPRHQLDEIRESRKVKKHLHIHSPSGGTVITVGVRRGQYVTPATELFFIADLGRVWVLTDIFEDELPWVSVGDRASITVAGVPGQVFEGNLTYIYPYAESDTRSIKARLEFDNASGFLKPEMFANVRIKSQPARHVLAVPSEAIIRSGLRERLFVVTEPGRFEPRNVSTGVSGEGWTRILDGVRLGEEVVVSAQFLIDSESSIREAAAKMTSGSQSDSSHD